MRRLTLIRHAPTAATRANLVPGDEPLDDRGVQAVAGLRVPGHAEVICSPEQRCRGTAQAAGLTISTVERAIAAWDFGRWRGRSLDDLTQEQPDDMARWIADPDSAPHGGETLRVVLQRVVGWLTDQADRDGTGVAITHGEVIKAAIIHALGAPAPAFWRVDCAPLSQTELHARNGSWTVVAVNCAVSARRPPRQPAH